MMKNLFHFLLLIPLFVFSQNSNFERTISITELNNELKQAANKGEDYLLENSIITYDSLLDYKYNIENLIDNSSMELLGADDISIFGAEYSRFEFYYSKTLLIEGVEFKKGSIVNFHNCSFITSNSKDYNSVGLFFRDCKFDTFLFSSDSIKAKHKIFFTEVNIQNMNIDKFASNIQNSNIQVLNLYGNVTKDDDLFDYRHYASRSTHHIQNNVISNLNTGAIWRLTLKDNNIGYTYLSGPTKYVEISNNNFHTYPRAYKRIWQTSEYGYEVALLSGLRIRGEFHEVELNSNKYFDLGIYQNRDTLLNSINQFFEYAASLGSSGSPFEFNNKALSIEQQFNVLKSSCNKNDSTEISFANNFSGVKFNGEFDNILIKNDSLDYLSFNKSNIKESIEISNIELRSFISCQGTIFPNPNNVVMDSSVVKIGFRQDDTLYLGLENYDLIKHKILDQDFIKSINSIIVQYREMIRIFGARGSDLLYDLKFMMKSVLTTQKQYVYHLNPSIENWFNWKGNEFLKWYSDYGQNPFKALSYCFWTMLYFAGFYFFFYSDWDKINKEFLMARFDKLILYFSTDKKLEDLYLEKNESFNKSYLDFQNSLKKNKNFIPSFVITLAKPLYQVSIIKLYLQKHFFMRAEVLSEHKWIDLPKNKRLVIGAFTFILIIIYSIYLIIVRGFNSLILSINAFSTLGFGQIPVKGFTKYVAIIEGFVGWFLLSIFLVSLLNQMINV